MIRRNIVMSKKFVEQFGFGLGSIKLTEEQCVELVREGKATCDDVKVEVE